jgi:tetrahydromethanopterin S-methyltransferase subunit G
MDKIERQIEKLAIAIANGFDEVHRRLDGIEKRLDGVETRLTELEHRVSDLHEDVLDARLSIQNLERNSISLAEHRELRTRVLRIEDKLGMPHEL